MNNRLIGNLNEIRSSQRISYKLTLGIFKFSIFLKVNKKEENNSGAKQTN
jgi:hypothetical protein